MAAAPEEITSSLVRLLVSEQFPQWSELPIRPVDVQGWDNRTFRLGDRMTVRLPSADGYVAGLDREEHTLGILASRFRVPIPRASSRRGFPRRPSADRGPFASGSRGGL